MTDEEQPAAFYDQSGQLVDIQYNAESIHVVNHLREGSNGKRCPSCSASPMRRTQLVWEENTRRYGFGTMLLSNVAVRVAPPRRPQPPQWQVAAYDSSIVPITILIAFFLSPYFLVSVILGTRAVVRESYGAVALTVNFWIAVLAFGAWLIWRIRVKKKQQQAARQRELDNDFSLQMRHYEAQLVIDGKNFRIWKKSWFCTSCTAIAVEDR